jgi:hypothetical protein
MKLFLILWALASAFTGFQVLVISKRAVHEIEASIAFLIMTLCSGVLAVIEAIEKLTEVRTNPES